MSPPSPSFEPLSWRIALRGHEAQLAAGVLAGVVGTLAPLGLEPTAGSAHATPELRAAPEAERR